jgi:hypothetical protein
MKLRPLTSMMLSIWVMGRPAAREHAGQMTRTKRSIS